MSNEYSSIDQFLTAWTEEFSRAVEMFAGEGATIEALPASNASPPQTVGDDYLWWKQKFEGKQVFTTWIGAKPGAWTPLGGALASPDDDPKLLFFEMLGQAQQGAATLLSNRKGEPVRCADGVSESPASLDSLILSEIKITFKGEALPPLIYAFDSVAAKYLSTENALEEKALPPPGISQTDQTYGPMLSRIMDLDLPLSVALGRATLPIQDILKLTSGSLIELDRRVGQSVELLIHGTVVAKGEVVSVRGNYAVRIREIISRSDRMALRQG